MKYKHLSQRERESIFIYTQEGKDPSEISRLLNRSPSTISRELERNSTVIDRRNNNNPSKKSKHYLPDRAENKYRQRRKESKSAFPLKNPFIYRYTLEKLKAGWTPEQISGRLKLEYGEKHSISSECIYQFIYSKKGRAKELFQYLTRRHKTRRKWKGRKSRKGKIIPNRVSIHDRPKEIDLREEGGHFEGDSIVGVGKHSALHTEVERVSRYLAVRKIDRKSAKETAEAMNDIFSSLPLRKSSTLDNGSEFVNHEKVTATTGIKIFFADPYSSYQRGTNENANGLIRRFFPKKTDFDQISDEEIQRVQNLINNRPKKCLGYKTPQEVYDELCQRI